LPYLSKSYYFEMNLFLKNYLKFPSATTYDILYLLHHAPPITPIIIIVAPTNAGINAIMNKRAFNY